MAAAAVQLVTGVEVDAVCQLAEVLTTSLTHCLTWLSPLLEDVDRLGHSHVLGHVQLEDKVKLMASYNCLFNII